MPEAFDFCQAFMMPKSALETGAEIRYNSAKLITPDAVIMRTVVKKRVHAFYVGTVQGVGFRMTAEDTANQFGVVGWVKNLRDGRVELLAEADEAILRQFLETLRTGSMRNFIQHVEVFWSTASEAFSEFEIRYY